MDEIERLKCLNAEERETIDELAALVTVLADALEEANNSAHNLKWQDWRDLIQKSREVL